MKQSEVTIHGVLIQRNQQVEAVTHIGNFLRASANREKRMAAANNRLVGVVGIQVQTTAAEDLCEDVARGRHSLTSGASNSNGEGLLHSNLLTGIPSRNVAFQFLNDLSLTRDNPFHQITN